MFDREVTVWESYDGRQQLIKDIPNDHLVNILNWVKNNKAYPEGLFEFLESEVELRQLVSFAKNEPFPRKKPTGYYELANQNWVNYCINKAKLLIIKRKMRKLIAKKG